MEQGDGRNSVEQVDGADCGAGGLSRLWSRWTEQNGTTATARSEPG